MPPKLPPVPAAAPTDGPSASVMDRWKSNVGAAPAPAPTKKRTGCAHRQRSRCDRAPALLSTNRARGVGGSSRPQKAKQSLQLDGLGPLEVLQQLKAVRSGAAKWCRKCAGLFDSHAAQLCPNSHPNFVYVKPAPELLAQLEEAEARICGATIACQAGVRGRAARRAHGPSARAALRLQGGWRGHAARRERRLRAEARAAARAAAREHLGAARQSAASQQWQPAIERLTEALAVEGTADAALAEEIESALGAAREGLAQAEAEAAARAAAREKLEVRIFPPKSRGIWPVFGL